MQTDGQTDVTKITVAFRNCADKPKHKKGPSLRRCEVSKSGQYSNGDVDTQKTEISLIKGIKISVLKRLKHKY